MDHYRASKLQNLLSLIENSDARVAQALVVFVVKLRTGNSNKIISTILQIKEEQLILKYCEQVIKFFENHVLSLIYFDLNALSKNDLIQNHSSAIAKKVHDYLRDKRILICDGTYAHHEKTSNNKYQRKLYSEQKKMCVCVNHIRFAPRMVT